MQQQVRTGNKLLKKTKRSGITLPDHFKMPFGGNTRSERPFYAVFQHNLRLKCRHIDFGDIGVEGA